MVKLPPFVEKFLFFLLCPFLIRKLSKEMTLKELEILSEMSSHEKLLAFGKFFRLYTLLH